MIPRSPRSSGDSMSFIIKKLSNNMFNNFISHVDYIQGDLNCGDIYLAHINNFINTKNATFRGLFVEYNLTENKQENVSVENYYKTIKKYLNPNLPLLLVGTNPLSQEIEIIQ
jgi:DNA topoisomerase VI subunit A